MRIAAIALAVLFAVALSSPAAPAAEGAAEKTAPRAVTADAVWNADKQAVQAAKQRCVELGGRDLEECFADAMQELGASSEAVAFTRTFEGGAFVRRFRETGRVDVAYIVYPFRISDNRGLLLVNGEPPIVDVDDIALLPKEGMEQDKTYAMIRKSYPRVTLWPGERPPKQPLSVEALPGGGQGFVIPYTLRNFCHACEILGTAFFSFDFDKSGKLTGIRFLRVELPPKKMPKNEARKVSEQISFVVMAEEGKEFTVRLSGNRTTGYQWRPAGSVDERVVRLVRCEYVPFGGPPVGGGGEEVFIFLAVGRGDTEITMEYVRPWEKNHPPAKTAAIRVSVRPASSR
jgi:inhibitor of cysteine peptidase